MTFWQVKLLIVYIEFSYNVETCELPTLVSLYIMHKRIDNFNPTWNFFLKSNSLFGNLLIYSQNFCIEHSAGYWFLNRSGHCVWQSWGGSHVKFSHNLTLNTRNASRKKFRTRSLLQRKLVWKIPKIWKIHST